MKLGVALRIASLLAALSAWEYAAKDATPFDVPPPSRIAIAFVDLMGDGSLPAALASSVQSLLIGFSLAVVAAALIAVIMVVCKRLRPILDIYLSVLLATPWAAVVPLVVIAVGIGLASRVVIVFAFCAPILAVNFFSGLQSTDPVLEEMAYSFGATRSKVFRKVKLPAAVPLALTGLRLGLGRAFVGMVVAELLLVSSGVGALITNFEARYKPDYLFATVLTLVVLGWFLITSLQWLERRMLWWQLQRAQ